MKVLDEILAELDRATKKFPTWPTDPLHALAVLGEEYGELNKEMLQLTYEPHKTSPKMVRDEAIQTAAMALRLAMSLDRYNYAPCPQHSQQDPCSGGSVILPMLLALPPEHAYWRNKWMFTRPVVSQESRQGTDPGAFQSWVNTLPHELQVYINNPPTK